MTEHTKCPVCGSGGIDSTWDVTPDGLPITTSDGTRVMHFWCYDCDSDWLADEFNNKPYVKQSHFDRYLRSRGTD